MTKQLTKKTLEAAAWTGGASTLRLLLRMVSVGVLARLLTSQEYGVVAGALVAMAFADMFYNLGLQPTLIQRKELRPDHVATALAMSLAMSFVAAVAMWFGAPLFAHVVRIPEVCDVVRVLAFFEPIAAFGIICEGLLAREMRTKTLALRPLASLAIAAFGVAIPLAYAGFGYWSLVAMEATTTIVTALTLGIGARRRLFRPKFSGAAFKELWPISFGFMLNQPFRFLAMNTDRFFIGRFLGAELLGLYTRASFLTSNAFVLFGEIARVSIFPAMAKIQDSQRRLQSGLLKSMFFVALLSMPSSAYCVLFADEIVDVILGAKWQAAAAPFSILSMLLYLQLSNRIATSVLQALGHVYRLLVIQVIAATVLSVSVVVVRHHGLAAICWAVVSANVMITTATLGFVRHALTVRLRDIATVHVIPVTATAYVVLLSVLAKQLMGERILSAAIVATVLGLSLVCVVWLASRRSRKPINLRQAAAALSAYVDRIVVPK